MCTICFTVNGARGPFVSEMCAFQVDSQPQAFTFLVSHSAPCVTADVSFYLRRCHNKFAVVGGKVFICNLLTGWSAASACIR